MNSEYIVVKLLTGETVMATLLHESDDTIIVNNPIVVRAITVTTDGGSVEKTVTNPYCTLTLEREFYFDRRHVLFVQPLHPTVIAFYNKLVTAFEDEFSSDLLDEPEEPKEELDELDGFVVLPDKNQIH